jgi:cell division transport system ATP-binding protein
MIVMADEPTGNLDPVVANQILDLFREINEQTGTTVLMATHHHGFLKRHPARVLYCDNRAVKDVQKELVIKKLSGE